MKICEACKRNQTYFEGCSRIPCPKRKPLTAQSSGEIFFEESKGKLHGDCIYSSGGTFKPPTTED